MQDLSGLRCLLTSAIAVVFAAAPVALNAQSANASISANVQQPITVTKTNDMVFGQVFPGVNSILAPSAAGAASFSVAGQASTNVNMSFTLPSTLSNGANTLTIGSWTGVYNSTNTPSGGTTFTPSVSPATVALSGAGALYIFVGATVTPTITQVAGSYTGQLTLTVVYF